jgi:aryl-alcohol dehydrogenase-like predicted oxidoreductase
MSDSTPSTVANRYSRRGFLGQALAGAGVVAAGSAWSSSLQAAPAHAKHRATDLVTLGDTGIKTSFLAQGTGFNGGGRSSAHTRLGEKAFERLVRHGMDQGVRLMDAADLYGSHRYIRHSLRGVPRDNYALLSKIWPREEYWNMASGGATKEVDRFRKELDSEVIDICLIHCMTNGNWPRQHERIRDELSELKQQGAVRAVGVSCHNFDALKVAAAHPWVDVILARINNKGASMDASVEEVTPVLKQARADGKVIIGMKLFGAGKLVQPDQKDASLKYVFENELVDAVTIGMLSTEQVDDTIKRMDQALKA